MINKEDSDRRQESAGSHRALWGHEKNFPASHEQSKPVEDSKQGGHIMQSVCLFLSHSDCHVNYGWQKNTTGREETHEELLQHPSKDGGGLSQVHGGKIRNHCLPLACTAEHTRLLTWEAKHAEELSLTPKSSDLSKQLVALTRQVGAEWPPQ